MKQIIKEAEYHSLINYSVVLNSLVTLLLSSYVSYRFRVTILVLMVLIEFLVVYKIRKEKK